MQDIHSSLLGWLSIHQARLIGGLTEMPGTLLTQDRRLGTAKVETLVSCVPELAGAGTLLTAESDPVTHREQSYPEDSADAFWDSADATRGYPEDSTDETNNSQQLSFD